MSHVSSHVASLPFRRLRTLPTKKTLDRRLVMCVNKGEKNKGERVLPADQPETKEIVCFPG